jgi:hypothetical protein
VTAVATGSAQDAHRLASLLSHDTLTAVEVRFQPGDQCYAVRWTGGPIVDFMQSLALGHAYEVPELAIDTLAWQRT